MNKIYFLLFFFFSQTLFAQTFESELRSALKEKPTFDFRLDNRSSFINQSGVRVFGLKAGFQFDNKLSFGLGYNFLWSDVYSSIAIEGNLQRAKLRYYNFSPYVEYVFYQDEKWQLAIPLQLGLGASQYKIEGNRYKRGFIMTYEPAISFEYCFLRYFGAGMGVGYRLLVVPNNQVEEQFNSPVYLFKLKLYLNRLLSDFGPLLYE